MPFFPLALLLGLLAQDLQHDPDTDGDGLSDFREVHKHFTDPARADSDGDGTPDGDWDERREYAYTVRSVVRVLPPVTRDVLEDDFQDARIRREGNDYIELEVIHYPLNTVGEAIAGDPDWRTAAARLAAYVTPGITANWDEAMRDDLRARFTAEGIDLDTLDDRATVEQVSRWLLEHAKDGVGFTTFLAHFPDGEATILPSLEAAAAREAAKIGRTPAEQWERELFARGMYEHGTRGSCTSTAIYLNGGLRAVGIPSRIVLVIPLVDASDADEIALLDTGLTHHRVRDIARAGIVKLGRSWSSHTFNEVFVGGRWRRLNYGNLGQGILDPHMFGLVTHVATFNDWADADIARTWGVRAMLHRFSNDAFGGANPYSTVELDDLCGVHARIDNPPVPAASSVAAPTIEEVYWYHSTRRPAAVSMRLDDPETAGHLLMVLREEDRHVQGGYAGFWKAAKKRFVLRAPDVPDVPAHATRGYWTGARTFYLRIEPEDVSGLRPGVSYRLETASAPDAEPSWRVAEDVRIVPLPDDGR